MDDLDIAVMIDKIALELRNNRKMNNDQIELFLIAEAHRIATEFRDQYRDQYENT